jgi:16S rRNA (cytosine967-C5)-methyltransferase
MERIARRKPQKKQTQKCLLFLCAQRLAQKNSSVHKKVVTCSPINTNTYTDISKLKDKMTTIMAKPPRIYPNLLRAAIDALKDIFEKKELTDVVVERTLRSDARWGARDRRWVAEEIYYAVRHYRALMEMLGRTPETLADWYNIMGIAQFLRTGGVPTLEQWTTLNPTELEENWADLQKIRAVRESLPEWLDQLAATQLGEALWDELLPALNQPAPLVLRVNRLKKTLREVQDGLARKEIVSTAVEGCLNALEVEGKPKLTELDLFRKGWFEIQDTASQQVSMFLQPLPNQIVVDACAGAGGKTLHLAALMQNKGKIFALDVEAKKLEETERRATRAGATIIETRQIKTALSYQDLINLADAVLIDAPCSGMGTLRRSVDLKWRLTAERLAELETIQADILQAYSQFVKVGGSLAYATCSVLKSENEDQIAKFLQTPQGAHFQLVKDRSFYPHTDKTDGFYVALLKKIS